MSRSPVKPAPKMAASDAPEFFETLVELATHMRDDPSGINIELNRRGEELLGVFQDQNYRKQFKNLRAQKMHAIEMAARDISMGVSTLRSSTIGISFSEGKLIPFVTPHGSSPRGSVVFSISWRNTKAFRNWRSHEGVEVSQDEINMSLYCLAVILSEVV